MQNKNILYCYNFFASDTTSQKRYIMQTPNESGPKGPDAKKKQESLPVNPDINDVDKSRDTAVTAGLKKIDNAQQLADKNEKQEKERIAAEMAEAKLDDAVQHFFREVPVKEQKDEIMVKIGKDYMDGLLKDPNFPGLNYLEGKKLSSQYGYGGQASEKEPDARTLGITVINGTYTISMVPKVRFSD